jgi:hypothetical protein
MAMRMKCDTNVKRQLFQRKGNKTKILHRDANVAAL